MKINQFNRWLDRFVPHAIAILAVVVAAVVASGFLFGYLSLWWEVMVIIFFAIVMYHVYHVARHRNDGESNGNW